MINIAKATESKNDPRRVDVHFTFAVKDPQREKIRKQLFDLKCVCSVRFRGKHDLIVRVKTNGGGCPRYEVINFAENNFKE